MKVPKLIWVPNPSCFFSVKSMHLCDQLGRFFSEAQGISSSTWKKLWKAPIHARWKNLIWRALSSALPTRDALAIRMPHIPTECPLCNQDIETPTYLFFHCPMVRAVWFNQ